MGKYYKDIMKLRLLLSLHTFSILARRDCYLMFKSLNSSRSGSLSLEEFFGIYNVTDLQWSVSAFELNAFSTDLCF